MERRKKFGGLGIALGAALGAAFGLLAGHMAVWLALGVAIGVALGATVRRQKPECPECAALHREHVIRNAEWSQK